MPQNLYHKVKMVKTVFLVLKIGFILSRSLDYNVVIGFFIAKLNSKFKMPNSL